MCGEIEFFADIKYAFVELFWQLLYVLGVNYVNLHAGVMCAKRCHAST